MAATSPGSRGCTAVTQLGASRIPPVLETPSGIYALSMNSIVTPADLSRELHRDQKTIRAYLRRKYGKLPPHDSRWNLTAEQADDVRRYFRKV